MSHRQIDRIARELWREIPRPRPKVPKAQKSWRQLTVGQNLRSIVPILTRGHKFAPGTIWTVIAVDSEGAWLTTRQPCGNVPDMPDMQLDIRWTAPEWKLVFERAGRKRT